MDCHHGHHHAHHYHAHEGLAEGLSQEHVNKLKWVMGLALFYLLVQLAGGYFSGSLALIAEAGHKLGDTGAIGLALFAAWFARLPASSRKTFGYARIEILAALINGVVLMAVAAFVLMEAYERLMDPHAHHVEGSLMFVVATGGLIINLISASLLLPAKDLNLNIKGAYFHVIADFLGSIGTLISAAVIMIFQVAWVDAGISILIAFLVLSNAIRILIEALHILMEAAPSHLSFEVVQGFIENTHGVRSVHDLHIWTITTGKDALLAHVVVEPDHFRHDTVMSIERALREKFDLCHITLQLEPPDFQEDEIPF